MDDVSQKAQTVSVKLSDCRGIVESSNLPDDLCKIVTDSIAESSAFLDTQFEPLITQIKGLTTENAQLKVCVESASHFVKHKDNVAALAKLIRGLSNVQSGHE